MPTYDSTTLSCTHPEELTLLYNAIELLEVLCEVMKLNFQLWQRIT